MRRNWNFPADWKGGKIGKILVYEIPGCQARLLRILLRLNQSLYWDGGMMRKPSTHKIITYAVLVACLVAAIYVFVIWGSGKIMDGTAPQMLTPIAVVMVADIAQYSGKSAVDHKNGVFDNPIVNAAVQGMGTDAATAAKTVADAIEESNPPNDQGKNNMAG